MKRTGSAGPGSAGSARRLVRALPPMLLSLFLLTGCVGPVVLSRDPNAVDLRNSLLPPLPLRHARWSHLLGTDDLGRDILTRLVYGARTSLGVALAVVFISGVLGVLVAVVAGVRGGRTDALLTRVADVSLAFPVLLLAIVLVGIHGPSQRLVVVILTVAGWPPYARVLRSEVIRIRDQEFVTMSRVMGGRSIWIIVRHVLPNLFGTFLVLATLQFGVAVVAEGSLSFLGLGVPPPAASWGSMLADGRNFLGTAWWLSTIPAIALSLTVLASNLTGDWLRSENDPALRS
jgi:peptide/nickel transport system permease protein